MLACGGGGSGSGSSYGAPTGSGVTSPIASSASYAVDHTTRTTVYSYADGSSHTAVDTVSPLLSMPLLTLAVYSSDWMTTGTVAAPLVSAKQNTYGDGYISVVEDGSFSKPFMQNTLSDLSITDPSKYVSSSTTTYNLIWGVPDKNGPGYANLHPNASNTLGSAYSYAGITVSGQTTAGPTLLQPSADVLAAWNHGWTGKGANILVIDSYVDKVGCTFSNRNCHGIMTMMNTDFIAPGASKYGLDFQFTSNFTGTAFDIAGTNLASSKSINVINMSWLFQAPTGSWNCNKGACIAPTDVIYNNGIADTAIAHSNLINVLNGVTSVANLSNLSGAVITAAAGNDNLDAKYNLTALALSGNASTSSRLLIVGALEKNGSAANPASMSFYSNYAGSNKAISDRFVLAYGYMPWAAGSVKINGSDFEVQRGTSFAAPLVAGYAAIITQKFPNLTAANTSNIILDTARTDTLSCSPSCNPAIYGKGEASLSRALAPVGRLR